MTQHRYSLDEIDALALPRVQAVCERLFGATRNGSGQIWMQSPTRSDPNWTSFSFNPRNGLWNDFGGALGSGKGVLSLVAATLGRGSDAPDWPAAIRWLKDFLGLTDRAPSAVDLAKLKQETARRDAESKAHVEKQRAAARGLWLHGSALDRADPVWHYLAGRGIDLAQLGGIPSALRFHPSVYASDSDPLLRGPGPAMLAAIARHGAGIVACHRTYLVRGPSRDGLPWSKRTWPACKTGKQVKGAYAGGYIALTRGASGKALRDAPDGEWVCVSEGIEDALSCALVKPELRHIAAVSISNIGGLVLPPQIKGAYIVRQNDTDPATLKQFDQAMDRLCDRGIEPAIVEFPDAFKDANDVLRGVTREPMGAAA